MSLLIIHYFFEVSVITNPEELEFFTKIRTVIIVNLATKKREDAVAKHKYSHKLHSCYHVHFVIANDSSPSKQLITNKFTIGIILTLWIIVFLWRDGNSANVQFQDKMYRNNRMHVSFPTYLKKNVFGSIRRTRKSKILIMQVQLARDQFSYYSATWSHVTVIFGITKKPGKISLTTQ